MEELQNLSSEKGIYGKILYCVQFFAIVVEECDNFQLGNYHYGHVYIVYQLHEGEDYRTQMVKTEDEVTKCVEKMKQEILTIAYIIDQKTEKSLKDCAKENEELRPLLKNVIGTKIRRFGECFPVYMEDLEDGSYVVYEVNYHEDIFFNLHYFKTENEAIDYAKNLSKSKVSKFYYHFFWSDLKADKIFGIAIKAYQNNWYLLQDEEGRVCSYKLVIDQQNYSLPTTRVNDFDDIESAEAYINERILEGK